MYILFVLLVGGGIGYFIGLKSTEWEMKSQEQALQTGNDQQTIQSIMDRQKEAYNQHDELLLMRDCSENYVEINGNSGEVQGLTKAIITYHNHFRSGKNINFGVNNPELKISGLSASIHANYFKTSDSYESMGIKGYAGEGIWLLAKSNGRWQICSFSFSEVAKK